MVLVEGTSVVLLLLFGAVALDLQYLPTPLTCASYKPSGLASGISKFADSQSRKVRTVQHRNR